MEILKTIHAASTRAHKRFLLIGGHALNVHGISRSTGDLDLMVRAQDVSFWKELLLQLGYDIFHESPAFIQSKPATLAAWPIDLIVVNDATMDKALKDAVTTEVMGPRVEVASVGSLIAMKLHALKFVDSARALKDQSDLLALLGLAAIPVNSESFRQLCLKYATIVIYERLVQIKS